MKSSTSIPFYLWKNTCRRWLEHPISPVSKILVPVLLGFLSIIVLSMFTVVERDLRQRLAESPAYMVMVEELVAAENAPTRLRRNLEEEVMWRDRYQDHDINSIRRLLMSAEWRGRQRVQVFVWNDPNDQFDENGRLIQVPDAVFWDSNPARQGQLERFLLKRTRLSAHAEPVPEWVQRDLRVQQALAVPVQMATAYLTRGFQNMMVLRFDSTAQVEDAVKELEAYYRAERRRVKITSALELLSDLERISSIQKVVRSLIVLGCGAILALILGSVAWLEYRQDAYLIALLRSFGSPAFVLLLHMLWENLLLVMIGLAIAWTSWPVFYSLASKQMQAVGLKITERPEISWGDHTTLLLAALLGCLLAMVPIAFGLRKPPGLTLQ